MKNKHQNISSIIAFALASFYIIGFVFLVAFFQPIIDGSLEKTERIEFMLNHKSGFQLWYLCIYILFGLLLVPLSIAIHERFYKYKLSQINTIFAFIWSGLLIASGFIFIVGLEKISFLDLDEHAKATVFTTIQIIQDALGGGVELIGGIWVFLIGFMAFKTKVFDKRFSLYSVVVGGIGILTIFPLFFDLAGVFGVLQIFWFIWLGFLFWNKSKAKAED